MKDNNLNICPHCKSTNTIKFGKTKENNQRYRCKECKKTFVTTRKRTKYTSKEKAFLSMFKNFLSLNDDFATSIREAVENISETDIIPNNFKFAQKSIKNSNEIHCYNPKLLICEDFNEITIYRFPQRPARQTKPRILKIIDDSELKKFTIKKNAQENNLSLKNNFSLNSLKQFEEYEIWENAEQDYSEFSDNSDEYFR